MTLPLEEKALINNLILDCNEMIDGKFILADSKISKILKDITESNEVFNLLSECMLNFNFEKEYARARIKSPTKPGYFRMPTEKYKLLPMAFCMMVDIENHKIDLQGLLREYFKGTDGEGDEFKNFTNEIIKPFRNAISEMFDLPLVINERLAKSVKTSSENAVKVKEKKIAQEEKVMEEKVSAFEELKKSLEDLKENINLDVKFKGEQKENAIIVVKGMIKACEYQDIEIINALIVAFEECYGKMKSIKYSYDKVKTDIISLYN